MQKQDVNDRKLSRMFNDLTRTNPIPDVTITLADNSIRNWILEIEGPEGSYYAGDTFTVVIDLTAWPDDIPKVKMLTPIVHPNISRGAICIDVLRHRDKVAPPRTVVDGIVNALKKPDFGRALDPAVATLFSESPALFERAVRQQISDNILARSATEG
jgi:ubiquitin-protein ligase